MASYKKLGKMAEDGIWGLVVGDALGVPVEFFSRESLKTDPVLGMRSHGTYNQPAGTWSDDSSMALCGAEGLTEGLDYEKVMGLFARWYNEGYMTPHGETFDIGGATRRAIEKYSLGFPALECGGREENDNGNGSLMRILPLCFYLRSCFGEYTGYQTAFDIIGRFSSLTHAHPISIIACSVYCSAASFLMEGHDIASAIDMGSEKGLAACHSKKEWHKWANLFDGLSSKELKLQTLHGIKSDGYVLNTLKAAFWCLLTTESLSQCLLKAVNLGSDTDTVAAVAGGLAGIYYEPDEVFDSWKQMVAKKDMIEALCRRFARSLEERQGV